MGEFSTERKPLSFEHSGGRIWQEIGRFCLQNKSSPQGESLYLMYVVSLWFGTEALSNYMYILHRTQTETLEQEQM